MTKEEVINVLHDLAKHDPSTKSDLVDLKYVEKYIKLIDVKVNQDIFTYPNVVKDIKYTPFPEGPYCASPGDPIPTASYYVGDNPNVKPITSGGFPE